MWGLIPAAGRGSRIQPLAFSKELLPVGSRRQGASLRPRAVSEYVVDRMISAGARKLCFVIAPGKSDIVEYYGGTWADAQVCYAVQPDAMGLCDALFRALPLISRDDEILVGLPDTVWFPEDGFSRLGSGLSFLLFPVREPELFDAVVCREDGTVEEIEVKQAKARSNWVWGAFKLSGRIFRDLHKLWQSRGDEYFGTLVNAYLAQGGAATAVHAGESYVDVGTVNGYHEALRLLGARLDSGAEETA